jgi:plastocyanin
MIDCERLENDLYSIVAAMYSDETKKVAHRTNVMYSTFRQTILICARLIFLTLLFIEVATPTSSRSSDAIIVKMTPEHRFVPDQIAIKAGQSVEWVNEEEGGIHQVTTNPDLATDPSDVSMPEGASPSRSVLST